MSMLRGMTTEEFEHLGETFGTKELSSLIRMSPVWVRAHAREFGGIRKSGSWVFEKQKVLELLEHR